MTLANKITVLRIFLVPIFMIFLLIKIPYGPLIAAGIFILAASTDGLDGYVARKQKTVTTLGKFLDPLADKLLITSALISLVGLGHLNPWIAVLIISREYAVTGLRLISASEGIIISASKLGKLKTISQIVAVVAIIIDSAFETVWFQQIISNTYIAYYPSEIMAAVTLFIAVILTIISGIDYFYKNKKIIKL